MPKNGSGVRWKAGALLGLVLSSLAATVSAAMVGNNVANIVVLSYDQWNTYPTYGNVFTATETFTTNQIHAYVSGVEYASFSLYVYRVTGSSPPTFTLLAMTMEQPISGSFSGWWTATLSSSVTFTAGMTYGLAFSGDASGQGDEVSIYGINGGTMYEVADPSNPTLPYTMAIYCSGTSAFTRTPTPGYSRTFTPTATRTHTPVVLTATPTATRTHTPVVLTATPTATRTFTPTATRTHTPVVLTATPTATRTFTPTATRTHTPVVLTATPTATRTFTPTATRTHTPVVLTATPTAVHSRTFTATPSPTSSWTPTATCTGTPTATQTASPVVSRTATPTATPTATLSPDHTRTFTPTRTPTSSGTPTTTRSATRTATASRTATPVLSPTPTLTVSPVFSPTPTATVTGTLPPTATFTPYAPPAPPRTGEVIAYPAPAAGPDLWFYFNLEGPAQVEIQIYDVVGNRMTRLLKENAMSGPQRLHWDIRDVAPGVYLFRMRTEGAQGHHDSGLRQLVIVK